MQSITRESYENRDLAITVNNIDYTIPPRTQEIQDKLIKIAKNKKITEYDRCFEIASTILGDKNAKIIFKNGKNENLDYMNMVTVTVLELYNLTKTENDNEKYQEIMGKIAPLADFVEKVEKMEDVIK